MNKEGIVIRVLAGFYDIECEGKNYRVRGSGKLRHNNLNPIVGDKVIFAENQFITEILERKNFLIRPKVANVDQVIIVTSLKEPNFKSLLLNKMLAIVELQKIKPIIIFTKMDLDISSEIPDDYRSQGYEVFDISNTNAEVNLDFKHLFKNKLTVFMGQSGVGKSSTINSISNANQDIQAISKALGRGKHTTRVVEIIQWQHGYLIDTPGFSSINLDMTVTELAKAWHDFAELSLQCKFTKNCIHIHEKECAIKNAVKDNKIILSRYNDYKRIIMEIQNG